MSINPEIFKAYDVRGLYPEQLNEEAVEKIGWAFVKLLKAEKVVVGRDMRLSSLALFKALAKGISQNGAQVIDIGLVSADALYFASGKLDLPGIFISASHNPAQWNGLKFCRAGAESIGQDSGLEKLKQLALIEDSSASSVQGSIVQRDITNDYRQHILSFIDGKSLRPLKIVIDAANGMAGKMVPLVFNRLPCQVIDLYFDLDGSFPHHPANPMEADNLVDCQNKVRQEGADLGMAFDGDGDRVFFIDERGRSVRNSLIIALLAKKILEKSQGEKIIYNNVSSWIVKETIKQYGGQPIAERTGHSFIKQTMKKTNAIFAAEHSGHYYFRDNYRADSGLIAGLMILEIISKKEKSFSELLKPFQKYFSIAETNFQTKNIQEIMKRLEERYQNGQISHLDGLTVEYSDWWFNLRPSNTEPLLRLNLEAKTKRLMQEKLKEVSQFIRKSL